MKKNILVVGGAGYIGSHVCKAIALSGDIPIVYDNLSTGHPWAIKWGPLFEGDILDLLALEKAFYLHKPEAVIHLASSIDVRESKRDPAKYYENNLVGTLSLLKTMMKFGLHQLIFSSSAAVYGKPLSLPMDETHPKNPINPYGKTKWAAEGVLEDFYAGYGLSSVSLRYFNAAGADPDGEIGECHNPETHLIPRILSTALQKQERLSIYGSTFPTKDGTAVRDYIHVSDLANGHVKALKWLDHNKGAHAFNLGTGSGFSIFETIKMVEGVTGIKIPYQLERANEEDPPLLLADPSKAKQLLDWNPEHSSLESIVTTAWRWINLYEPIKLES